MRCFRPAVHTPRLQPGASGQLARPGCTRGRVRPSRARACGQRVLLGVSAEHPLSTRCHPKASGQASCLRHLCPQWWSTAVLAPAPRGARCGSLQDLLRARPQPPRPGLHQKRRTGQPGAAGAPPASRAAPASTWRLRPPRSPHSAATSSRVAGARPREAHRPRLRATPTSATERAARRSHSRGRGGRRRQELSQVQRTTQSLPARGASPACTARTRP
mmetsp:Transcript_27616/g.87764  ORF Transcript_27616/g.87764 Transcript_27616/m.87764 type:complete len:218 (+) Transcript_27616:233-886(+)